MKINKHTIRCFNDHFGHWMMEEKRFSQLYHVIMSENITFGSDSGPVKADKHDPDEDRRDADVFEMFGDIMIIPIEGTIMRAESSFGGVSSVQIRRIIRGAANNPEIKGIMLKIDSPGGTVAGTDELAQEIRAANLIKPVHTHVDGLIASAAFWVGSQVSRLTITRTSEAGSLGTVAVVNDMSEMAKKEGIKVHVISTGKFKGAFTPGSEVTEDQLDDLRSIVEKLNVFFKEAVQDGRQLEAKVVNKLFDGRVHVAQDALELGLIDGISGFEEALRVLLVETLSKNNDSEEALARARVAKIKYLT